FLFYSRTDGLLLPIVEERLRLASQPACNGSGRREQQFLLVAPVLLEASGSGLPGGVRFSVDPGRWLDHQPGRFTRRPFPGQGAAIVRQRGVSLVSDPVLARSG